METTKEQREDWRLWCQAIISNKSVPPSLDTKQIPSSEEMVIRLLADFADLAEQERELERLRGMLSRALPFLVDVAGGDNYARRILRHDIEYFQYKAQARQALSEGAP
jgi:hypothetical protein